MHRSDYNVYIPVYYAHDEGLKHRSDHMLICVTSGLRSVS